jgi:AraC-like DNA-binding protein
VNSTSGNIAGSKHQQFAVPNIEPSFAFYRPKPPLSKFVEIFWAAKSGDPAFRPERILPTGTFELAINLRQDKLSFHDLESLEAPARFSGSVVSGAHGRSFAPADTDYVSVIGVHFRPGGAFPFLGAPAGELADAHIDLDTLWGRAAGSLRERLCEARSAGQRFELLQDELLRRLRDGVERHYAVSTALEMFQKHEPENSVGETAKYVGLSQRRFIQVFKAEVGLTPKLFSRIQRFQRARRSIHHDTSPDWTSVALDSGYCDQSHFIREFVEFSGISPTDYLNRQDRSI